MIGIVRIALSRPYTFVVMALLILIFGRDVGCTNAYGYSAEYRHPVVAAVWSYNGMAPDDMSGRVVYYYERTLSSQVNDISHIESQSMFGLRRGEDLLPAQRQHQFRVGAGDGGVADRAEAAAFPALRRLTCCRSTHPACRYCSWRCRATHCHRRGCSITDRISSGRSWPRWRGAAIPSPYGGKVRQIQIRFESARAAGSTDFPRRTWWRRWRSKT